MIADSFSQQHRYVSLHRRFAEAFSFLESTDLAALPDGKHVIDGEQLFASVIRKPGISRDDAVLEIHRRYIDIQYLVSGKEEIGWKMLARCSAPKGEYDPDREIRFFQDHPSMWLHLDPGMFAVFFPADAHAPMVGRGPLHKVVVKVALEE